MKKSYKYSYLIAFIFILVGIVISVIGLAVGGFEIKNYTTRSYEKKEVSVEAAEITKIITDIVSSDINIVYKDIDEINITYYEEENEVYQIKTDNGQLKIIYEDNRKWYQRISFGFYIENNITIELPKDMKVDLDLNTVSGVINVSDIISDVVKIKNVSGEIEVKNIQAESVVIKSTSGEMDIRNIQAENVVIEGKSGDVNVNGGVGDIISIKTISGEISVNKIEYNDITLSSTSGEIEGTIIGNESDYNISSDTVSGDNNLRDNIDGDRSKRLTVNTTSGGIDINFR